MGPKVLIGEFWVPAWSRIYLHNVENAPAHGEGGHDEFEDRKGEEADSSSLPCELEGLGICQGAVRGAPGLKLVLRTKGLGRNSWRTVTWFGVSG